jgi:hypothetical protein
LHTYSQITGDGGSPLTVLKYFTAVIDQAHVILYSFSRPDIPLCFLQFPTFISFPQLSAFVARAMRLELDPERDCILLFKKDSVNNLPARQWLQPEYYPCAKYVCSPGPTFEKLYFRVEKGVPPSQLPTLRWYFLQIAPDGITPASELTGKIVLPTATIHDLIPESLDPQNVRISLVFNSKFQELLTFDAPLPSGGSHLRIDVVPEDQRSLNPETERLVQVAFALPDSSSQAVCRGDPFWFKIVKGETVETLRRRLEAALGLSADEFAKYEMMIGGDWTSVRKSRFLKPEGSCWDEYQGITQTTGTALLLIDRTYKPARSPEEVLKIRN